ncbi:MAG TPA: transposase, partial [Rhodopila sp.]
MRGLTDVEFERLYGTEEACLAALVVARQQAGMTCPRCGHAKSYV